MTFSRRILNKPLTIVTFFVIISIAGITLVNKLSVDLLPQLDVPVIAVITTYPMASPTEVEENVTKNIEEALVNVSGLEDMTSLSGDSYSQVVLEFAYGTDLNNSIADVRDKLERISSRLPESSDTPLIWTFDPNAIPILELSFKGEQNLNELLSLAENEVKPQLERITGVAEVSISGGVEDVVLVEMHQQELDALNLSIAQISAALAQQNMKLGAGEIDENGKVYLIQTSGHFQSVEELANTVIAQRPLSQTRTHEILLRDVADVSLTNREKNSTVLINGEEAIRISITKKNEANIITVSRDVQKTIDMLSGILPNDTELSILRDNSEMITQTLSQVVSSAAWGILFAVIVLLFFLRQFKTTLIVAISIPVSLLITIGGMSLGGKTFNVMTLTGLVLALGMIVDGSIVILENIFNYRQKGILLKTSAELGTQEMISPIIGSILTTVCVFLPLLIFKNDLGLIGIIFEDMSFTIIIALISSLAVALLLVPVLAFKVFPIHTRKEKPIKNEKLQEVDEKIENGFQKFTAAYRKAVEWSIKKKGLVFTISIILFIFSLVGAGYKAVGMVMMPDSGETSIILNVEMPEGTSLDITEEVMLQWQSIINDKIPDMTNLIISAGSGGQGFTASAQNVGSAEITLPPAEDRTKSDDELRDILRNYFEMFPDAQFSFTSTDQSSGMNGSSDISLLLKSNNMEELTSIADEITELMTVEFGEELTEVANSQSNALPQIELVLDRAKIYDLGLNTQTIAYEIRSQIAGITSTTYSEGSETYDVVLQLREEDRNSSFDIDKIFVTSMTTGEKIPFASFGEANKNTGPVSIARDDRVRTLTLTANKRPNAREAGQILIDLERAIEEQIIMPEGMILERGGQQEEIAELFGDMKGVALMILILIIMLSMISLARKRDKISVLSWIAISLFFVIGFLGMFAITQNPMTSILALIFLGMILLRVFGVKNDITLKFPKIIGVIASLGASIFIYMQAGIEAGALGPVPMVLFFAALLVFAVMVSQFESLKDPFIIFIMIPMLLIGVVAVYFISGLPFSLPSMIGIVMLLGIVVNNGIILVDATNLTRKRGHGVIESAAIAAESRLKPVLMTTLTTVLAMVPMAFFPGKGAEMVQPMGMTVIGGLVSNTVMTLFLIPALYTIFHRHDITEAEHKALDDKIAAEGEL